MRASGTLLCLSSAAAFGAMAVFGKLAYEGGATVGTLLAVRFLLASALFWGVVLARGGAAQVRRLPRRDVALALGLGALGYAGQAGAYFAALERIDASLLSLLVYTFPAMVTAAAILLGRERPGARRLTALALTSTGLALVVAGAGAGALDPAGTLLGLGAAVVYSAYILVAQPAGVTSPGRSWPSTAAPGVRVAAAPEHTSAASTCGGMRAATGSPTRM